MMLEPAAHPLFHHPPPQLHRVPATCDLHPDEVVTGFCASCLRDRLASLQPSSAAPHPKPSSGLRSLFLRPELRRCKSFSAARADGSSAAFEPQRKSCDVRGRNTLWSLFNQDDRHRNASLSPSSNANTNAAEIHSHHPGALPPPPPPPPVREEEEEVREDEDEIRPADLIPVRVPETTVEIVPVDEAEVEAEATEMKPMKEHIDLDSTQAKKPPPPTKDLKEIAGSFWLAASVFSKKLQKWRRKQKLKKHGAKTAACAAQTGKPPSSCSRRFRDTQSEIAVDAFGRRSCDIDPRFSLDAGRISFDDPRQSWDEPRASWDGYLIGGRSVFPRLPPMLAVEEDPPAPTIQRSDGQIPVEADEIIPGGSLQTRDYYLDSSSQRRRRSLDHSNSTRKLAAEVNELKLASSAMLSPTGAAELFHAHNGNKVDRDSRDSSSTSLRDDYSESFASAYRDPQKADPTKKTKRWSKGWSIWGFIHWRSSGRGGGGAGANGVERSFSESWPELRRNGYGGGMLRSNSSVSSRHSFSGSAGLGSMRRNSMETNGHAKKRREEFMFERNRSARYSPSHVDNGMLRFYLTPSRSSRRNGALGKNIHRSSESFTRTMLRMY